MIERWTTADDLSVCGRRTKVSLNLSFGADIGVGVAVVEAKCWPSLMDGARRGEGELLRLDFVKSFHHFLRFRSECTGVGESSMGIGVAGDSIVAIVLSE